VPQPDVSAGRVRNLYALVDTIEGSVVHYGRIVAIVGVIVSAVGLFLKSASSGAEAIMDQLHAANEAIPAGFDTVWTAIYDDKSWAAILLAAVLVAIVIWSLLPPVKAVLSRIGGMGVTVLGVIVIVIGGIATLDALDQASDLQDAFAMMFAGGLIPEAYTVSIGLGWVLLIVGGGVAAVGGVLSIMANPGGGAAASDSGSTTQMSSEPNDGDDPVGT
jgi:hypothetical protein